jgi:two-component system copper resistance phosphate regulon response regulator CusR
MRILVVEDDTHVANTLQLGLRKAQYDVDVAPDGERALVLARREDYDLVVLDMLLPKLDGIDVLRTLRAAGNGVPVLILSAREQIQDRVAGLDAGADDYLTKPFGLEELLARVRALMRRRGTIVPTVLRAADLEMDTLRRRVTRQGKDIMLTNREFELLAFLLRCPNEIVSRSLLAEKVWGYPFDPASNVIDVHVAHLRSKIDDGFEPRLLHTVRGQGYRIECADVEGV